MGGAGTDTEGQPNSQPMGVQAATTKERPRFAGPLVPINIQLDEIENNAVGTRKATPNKARAINAQLSERGATNEVPKVSISSEGGKPKEVAKPEVEAQQEVAKPKDKIGTDAEGNVVEDVPISELITTFVKNNSDGIPERVSQGQHPAQTEADGGVEEKPTASITGIEKTIRDAQRDSETLPS